jgi:hypothetical protein
MMPILISSGVIRPGQLGPSSRVFLPPASLLGLHLVAHHQHVAHRDALGDADDQVQVGLDGFPDGGSGAGRRHIDHATRWRRFADHGFLDRGVDGDVAELLAGLLGVDAGHEAVLAVGVSLAAQGVELAGLAGDALGDDAVSLLM